MINLFKIKGQKKDDAANTIGKHAAKKQSPGELRLHKGLSFSKPCCSKLHCMSDSLLSPQSPVHLNLSVWLISHGTVFFSQNKSASSTFQLGLLNAFLFFAIIFWFFLTCIDTSVYLKTSSFLCCTFVGLGGYLLSLHFFLADIAELNLPKTTKITFPNGKDDLMNFECTIKPDEGYYM